MADFDPDNLVPVNQPPAFDPDRLVPIGKYATPGSFNPDNLVPVSKPPASDGPTPEQMAGYRSEHPILGRVFNAANAINQGAVTGVNQLIGMVAPKFAQDVNAQNTAQNPVVPNTVEGMIGTAVGGALPVVAASAMTGGAATIPMMAGQGVGAARMNAAAQREQGQNVSGASEALDAAGQGVLNAAMGKLFGANINGGAAAAVEGQLSKVMPNLIAKYGAAGAVDAAINLGQNFASNAVTKATVNPNQDLTEGSGQAALSGAAQGIGFKAAHGNVPTDHAPAQEAQGMQEPARPEAVPAQTTTPAPNALAELRARMEASRSEGDFGPAHEGTQAQVDQMHHARIAEEDTAPAKTPEQQAAEHQEQLTKLHPNAQIEPGPATGRENVPPEARNDIRDLEHRLNKVERRVDTTGENQGRREADIPAHEFKSPEAVEQETLKSKLTPNETVRQHAEEYAKQAGINHQPDRNYEPVDTDRAKQIADAYEAMPHNPNDPAVKASYDALKKETLDQYNYLKDQGVKIEPAKSSPVYPSSKAMMEDVAAGHLFYDKTSEGHMPADHPLNEEAPGTGGMKYNDVFRAVHDYFGHAQEGNGFGPKGEEHAWKQHAAMYSDEARPAMTAETRGQNFWVNYGPKGEENRANPQNTTFAQQKAGLLPSQFNGGKSSLTAAPGIPTQGSNVLSSIRNAVTGIKNKFIPPETPAARKASLDIREAQGQAENEGHKFEAKIAPARQHVPTFENDPAAAKAWMDEVEKGNIPAGSHADVVKALEANKEQRMENAQDAIDLGIKHLDVEGEGMSRLFTFPDATDTNRSGVGASLAGTNNPLRGQKYDTFSEAYDAAIKNGGKPKFNNPLDMQVARQYQVEKNFAMRNNMRAAEDAGVAKWVPDGEQAPEGFKPIDDRIIGSETRKQSLPSSIVGRAAQLPMFEGQKLLDQNESQMEHTRPGPNDFPDTEGHAFTGRETPGQFYMPPEIAEKYNNFAKFDPSQDPHLSATASAARVLTNLNYSMSMVHGARAVMWSTFQHMADAVSHAAGGDMGRAFDSMKDAATGGLKSGSEFRKQLASGTAGETGDRAMAGNFPFKLDSVTNDAAKGFVNSVKTGDYKGALDSFLGKAGHDLIYNKIMPNILASHAKAIAESQMERGVSATAGREEMVSKIDALRDQIGAHMDTPEFKKNLTKQILGAVFPAARFEAGQYKTILGGITNPKVVLPSVLMGATATALFNSATQMILSKINTGNAELPTMDDAFLGPRTGGKAPDGRENRLEYPNPISHIYRLVRHPINEVGGMFSGPLRAIGEDIANKDFSGNQVEPEDGSALGNAARAVGHVAKSMLPISAQDVFKGKPDEGVVAHGLRALAGVAGIGKTPVTSPAEQSLYEALHNRSTEGGRNLQAQDIHDSQAQWADQLRNGTPLEDVVKDMKSKPWITESIAQSVVKRSQEPTGVAGLVRDSTLQPEDLGTAWDKASDEEKAAMKPELEKRFSTVEPKSSLELSKWKNLYQTVNGDQQ